MQTLLSTLLLFLINVLFTWIQKAALLSTNLLYSNILNTQGELNIITWLGFCSPLEQQDNKSNHKCKE